MIIDRKKVELFYIVNCYFMLININSLPAFFFLMILIILVILAPKPIEAMIFVKYYFENSYLQTSFFILSPKTFSGFLYS